jgi:hypothetical protein
MDFLKFRCTWRLQKPLCNFDHTTRNHEAAHITYKVLISRALQKLLSLHTGILICEKRERVRGSLMRQRIQRDPVSY